MSDDLAAWLLTQIAEDEERAREMLLAFPTPWELSDRGWMAKLTADGPAFRQIVSLEQWPGQPDCSWLGDFIRHLDGWNPDRVLAECEAKRLIIEAAEGVYVGWLAVKYLGLPYADRPGYREEWRP